MGMKKKRLLTNRGEFEMTAGMWEKGELVRLLKGAPGTQYQEANDANKSIMRDWVRGLLQQQSITVTFNKADGTDRDMKCTLNWELIPEKPPMAVISHSASIVGRVDGLVTETKKPRKEPDPAVVKVYDLEAKAWRSFRMDRLKKITAELVFE
jgi:hypothetical protein